MWSADTNVLVRLLVSDDLAQQQAVVERLERIQKEGECVLVSAVVMAELSWVLKAVYRYERSQIAMAVDRIMWTAPFRVTDRHILQSALTIFAEGGAELSDCIILAWSLHQGAEKLLTFDRRLLRHPACVSP